MFFDLDMTNFSPRSQSSQIIELIFQDAQKSITELEAQLSLIETKLNSVTGFGVLLIKFLGELPGQITIKAQCPLSEVFPYYSCAIFKTLSLITLLSAIGTSL